MEEERRGLAAVLSVTVIFRCSVRHSVHPPLGVPELTLCRLHIGLLVSWLTKRSVPLLWAEGQNKKSSLDLCEHANYKLWRQDMDEYLMHKLQICSVLFCEPIRTFWATSALTQSVNLNSKQTFNHFNVKSFCCLTQTGKLQTVQRHHGNIDCGHTDWT